MRILDSSDKDGYDEDEETDSYMRTKKSRKSKKKQQGPTQTLLKFLDGGGGKKQVSFEVNKKKKCKYSKRQQTAEDGDDSTAFEDLEITRDLVLPILLCRCFSCPYEGLIDGVKRLLYYMLLHAIHHS